MSKLTAGFVEVRGLWAKTSWYPWLIWGLGAAFFFAEYFARVSPAVMVSELMTDLQITGLGFGNLSLAFYVAYLGMQLPVGMLVDRYGAHRMLVLQTLVTAVACYMFSIADNLFFATISRFIMGFGAAFAFVGALKLASVWFDSSKFGFLSGATQSLGMLGAAIGEGPVSISVNHLGWRPTMLIMGSVLLLLSIAIKLLVTDHPDKQVATRTRIKSNHDIWRGLMVVLRNKQTWYNAIFAGLIYAPMACFGELWGVDYLAHTHAITKEVAAGAISMIFLGWGLGGAFTGLISDKLRRRKPLLFVSAILSLLTLLWALYITSLSISWLYAVLFLFGVFNTGLVVSYAIAGEINPRPVAGISIAFANMVSVIIGALLQPVVGWLLDLQATAYTVDHVPIYTYAAYQNVVIIFPMCLVLAIVFACFVRETHCMPIEDNQGLA